MLEIFEQIDSAIFLMLNSFHHPAMDTVMYAVSGKWTWIPLYVAILYVMIIRIGWKSGLFLFLCIVATIACSDQICASVIRPVVGRLRPSNLDNPISQFVHIVDGYRGGRYGFPSCHGSNTFALATIISLSLRSMRLSVILYYWALLNCYSRIYLGVHYPGDLVVGGMIGMLSGYLFYTIYRLSAARLFEGGLSPRRVYRSPVSTFWGN